MECRSCKVYQGAFGRSQVFIGVLQGKCDEGIEACIILGNPWANVADPKKPNRPKGTVTNRVEIPNPILLNLTPDNCSGFRV